MKRILVALTVMIAATLVAATMASANGVPRYQMQTATLTASVNGGKYFHTYSITISPCDGSFSGTSSYENVTGSWDGTTLDFYSTYTTKSYWWSYDGPLDGSGTIGSTGNTVKNVVFTLTTPTNTTDYKNHGAYVSQNPDKNDAAHSCLGMPMKP